MIDHESILIRELTNDELQLVGAGIAGYSAPSFAQVAFNFARDLAVSGLGVAMGDAILAYAAPLFD